jgi:hypothetical protein
MPRRTAFGRDQRVLAVVLDAHQRDLARLVAAHRHHHDRQASVAQRVGLLTAAWHDACCRLRECCSAFNST